MPFIINKQRKSGLQYGIPFIMNNKESVNCAMLFLINSRKKIPSSLPTVITRKLTRLTIIATKNL